jgi:hypothetical protein
MEFKEWVELGNPELSIFVVFDRSQTYPEYLIKYTVKTENVMTTSHGVSSPSTSSYMHQPVTSSNPGLSFCFIEI